MGHQTISELTDQEQQLWQRVDELWQCSLKGDFRVMKEAIHPQYTGWDATSVVPHDRNYAIKSVSDKSARLIEYKLFPLKITIYENQVGIVNYRYNANIQDQQKNIRAIKGRWTEVFFKSEDSWILIGVHGESESVKVINAASIY